MNNFVQIAKSVGQPDHASTVIKKKVGQLSIIVNQCKLPGKSAHFWLSNNFFTWVLIIGKTRHWGFTKTMWKKKGITSDSVDTWLETNIPHFKLFHISVQSKFITKDSSIMVIKVGSVERNLRSKHLSFWTNLW